MMRPPVRVTRASSAAAVRGSTSAHSITSMQSTQSKAPLRNGRWLTSATSARFGWTEHEPLPRVDLVLAPGLRADVHRDDLCPALEQEERDDGVVVVVVAHDGARGHGAGSDALPAPDGDELVERPPGVAPR